MLKRPTIAGTPCSHLRRPPVVPDSNTSPLSMSKRTGRWYGLVAPSVVWPLTVGVALVLLLLVTPGAEASYMFLGIGNDGYFSDVSGLRDALESQSGWDDAEYHLRKNLTGDEVLAEISWLEEAGPGDVVVWYYSGHGGSNVFDANDDEGRGASSNTYDESIGLLADGCWATDDEIADALAGVDPSVPIVAIVDSCHAGGFVGGSGDLNKLDNVVAILSSQEYQNSYGGSPFSLFTAGLISGLGPNLPADVDGDGVLYTDEWFNYVTAQTPFRYSQDPVYWASPGLERVAVVPEPGTSVALLTCTLLLPRRRVWAGLRARP
jgi:hypothetical protein